MAELTALACGLNVTLGTGTFTTAGWREAEKDRTAARSTSHTSQREASRSCPFPLHHHDKKPARDTGRTHAQCVRGRGRCAASMACGCGTAIRRWSNPCRSAFIHGPFPNRGVWGLVVASTGGRSWRPVALLDERMSGVVCFCGDLNLCTHQVSSNSAAAGLASRAFRTSVIGASGPHSQMHTMP